MKKSVIIKKWLSKDGTTKKFLFKLNDGQTVESVLMKCRHGYTVCVSSQVGCKMNCAFCATGKSGFYRNLTSEEIFFQVEEIQKEENIKITCVTVMGMGEPFENYVNVIDFMNLATQENGLNINSERMTVSTCGLVDKIYEFSELKKDYNLAISLHATRDDVRNQIMKINRKWNIEELMKACKFYNEKTNKSIIFEYIMIDGLNDSEKDANELVELVKNMSCRVVLIPVNPTETNNFKPSSELVIDNFLNILIKGGIKCSVRNPYGNDINAACGQLRLSNL